MKLNYFSREPKSDKLMGRAIRGGGLLAVGTVLENALRLGRNIVLARFLAPEAFGVMAIVLAANSAVEAFTEIGLRQSIIQNKRGSDPDFLNACWWISVTRATTLYILAFLAAPYIAGFYGKPQMTDLLRVAFLSILFNGFMSPLVHVLEKQFRFKTWVALVQGCGAFSVLCTIAAGFYFRNVWALVLGYSGELFLRFLLSFVVCPLRPRLSINREAATEIFRFSRGMLGLPILMTLFLQTDMLVVGRMLSLTEVGMYALAKGLAEIPYGLVSRIVHPVILPSFSVIQEDKEKLRTTLLAATEITATFFFPFTALMITCAGAILGTAYGPSYAMVAGPFSVLCVYIMILVLSSLIMTVYLAVGSPGVHRNAALVRTAVLLVLIYPAIKLLGLYGAAVVVLIAMCTSIGIQLIYARKVIELGIQPYLRRLLPGLGLSLVVLVPGILAKILISSQGILSISIGVAFCLLSWAIGLKRLWKIVGTHFDSTPTRPATPDVFNAREARQSTM